MTSTATGRLELSNLRRMAISLCVLSFAIAGCGGEDGAADPAEPTGDARTDTTSEGAFTQADDESQAPDADRSGDGPPNGLPPGGTGTVVVDGETIEARWVGNCEIDEMFDPHPEDLDLTASLDGGLQALFLEVSNQELMFGGDEPYAYVQVRPGLQIRDDSGSMVNYESVYVTGPEGEWYEDTDGVLAFTFAQGGEPESDPLDSPPLVLEDGRATGSFALDGSGEPVEVSYDLNFIDPVDCSL